MRSTDRSVLFVIVNRMTDRFELPTTARAAVATLIATQGATPKEAGAKMWVDDSGRILGSVTIGGCVDARVIEEAAAVISSNTSRLLNMSLGDEDAWALGMTCGGSVSVLIEPYSAVEREAPIVVALQAVNDALAAGKRAVMVVPLDDGVGEGRLVLVEGNERVTGSLGSAALDRAAVGSASEALRRGATGTHTVTVDDAEQHLYCEVHAPPVTLTIFGATHVAIPLVELARILGLRTCVVDGRERFATRERFPHADELRVGIPSELAERMSLGATSLVVLLSHDYKYDLPVLKTVLASDAAYVGLLGSARRGKALLDFLADEGVPRDQLDRVRVPVGLDIGAKSAAEIALSVLAEALAVLRSRPGGPLRDRQRGKDGSVE
jgi:xanthine dehydrogenase accessory factor